MHANKKPTVCQISKNFPLSPVLRNIDFSSSRYKSSEFVNDFLRRKQLKPLPFSDMVGLILTDLLILATGLSERINWTAMEGLCVLRVALSRVMLGNWNVTHLF